MENLPSITFASNSIKPFDSTLNPEIGSISVLLSKRRARNAERKAGNAAKPILKEDIPNHSIPKNSRVIANKNIKPFVYHVKSRNTFVIEAPEKRSKPNEEERDFLGDNEGLHFVDSVLLPFMTDSNS